MEVSVTVEYWSTRFCFSVVIRHKNWVYHFRFKTWSLYKKLALQHALAPMLCKKRSLLHSLIMESVRIRLSQELRDENLQTKLNLNTFGANTTCNCFSSEIALHALAWAYDNSLKTKMRTRGKEKKQLAACWERSWTCYIGCHCVYVWLNCSWLGWASTYLYDFIASTCRFSMNCWNVGKAGKLSCSEGGSEKGSVGLQLAVLVVSSVNSALTKMKMNFFSRCFVGCDDIFGGGTFSLSKQNGTKIFSEISLSCSRAD